MGLFPCADMIWGFVILCLLEAKGVLSGSYCNDNSGFITFKRYCSYGCCSDEIDGCCNYVYVLPVGGIVGGLVSLAVVVGFVICICCMCRRRRSRGQVVQNQPQVIISQNTVQTNNMPYGYAYPAPQATYPQNPPPYSPPAYPPQDTQPKTLPPTNASAPPMPYS